MDTQPPINSTNTQTSDCNKENLEKLLLIAIQRLKSLNNHVLHGKSLYGYKYYNSIIGYLKLNDKPEGLDYIVNNISQQNIKNLLYSISEQITPFKTYVMPNVNVLEILCKSYGNIQAFYYLSYGTLDLDQLNSTAGGKSKRNIKPKSDKRRTRRRKYFRYTPDKSKKYIL